MTVVVLIAFLLLSICATAGCKRGRPIIAFIPRTTAIPFWDVEYSGAAEVARAAGLEIYWNAPSSDDDIQSQLSMVEQVTARGFRGLIVAPVAANPMRVPVLRIASRGIPVVVIGTALGIPPSKSVAYVLNDEDAGGQMAARRVGSILHGTGSIAIVGIDSQLPYSLIRQRSLETTLASEFPGIRVQLRDDEHSSVAQEESSVAKLLSKGEKIDAIIALSLVSTRGAYYALVALNKEGTTKLIGFDQDLLPPLRAGGLDSVIAENTYEIGKLAMKAMECRINGGTCAPTQVVPPVLITSANIDSPQIQGILYRSLWSNP